MRSRPDRGVVLVMVIGILATLAVAGTAFVVYMRQANQAAVNTGLLAQAELAARSGLEHAVAVIEASLEKLEPGGDWLAVTPDGALDRATGTFTTTEGNPDAGWHRYFEEDDPSAGEQLSERTRWVSHYWTDKDVDGKNDEKYGAELFGATEPTAHNMRGRVFGFPVVVGPTKRGEYAVCVADLDGKLHANLAKWNGGLGNGWNIGAFVSAVAEAADSDVNGAAVTAQSAANAFSSLSEVARRAGASTVGGGKYALEKVFTVYPIHQHETWPDYTVDGNAVPGGTTSVITVTGGGLTPGAFVGSVVLFDTSGETFGIIANDDTKITVLGDCSGEPADAKFYVVPRPTVSVNTVSELLLAELITPVRSFLADADADGPKKAAALAKHICASRPFADRHELEEALRRVTGEDAVMDLKAYDGTLPDDNKVLNEKQFNDLLNSAAGLIGEEESAYDDPDPDRSGCYAFDGWAPFQDGVGPAQTGGQCTNTDNVTWSTELKFTSRFFHVYVIGRGWHWELAERAGVKRLHAIYDSEKKRIVWMRWNLSSRGSVADIQ